MGPQPAVAEVRSAVRAVLADAGPCLLVACSGGADSLALAAAVAFEAPRAGLRAGMVTVDHGLQEGSAEQARRVAALGYELGFDPVEVIAVEVDRADGGPENAAREARYAALESAATCWGASLLLGHTLDDQAESVLLGLGRGSGPRSIAGMRTVDRRLSVPRLRPFLGLRRATTQQACAALGLEPWDDPQNADAAFRRVRLRHEVLPLLEDVLAGGVAEALARTARQVQDDLDALELWAGEFDAAAELAVDVIADLPRAVRSRILMAWAQAAGARPLTAEHVAALDALVTDWRGQGPIDLPGGRRAARASGKLTMSRG
jgi:tRNA(Ile)-lysidine synthase